MAMACVAVLSATGCGGGGHQAPSNAAQPPVSTTTASDAAATVDSALHGIIVLGCAYDANAGTHTVQLDAYDADSGATTGNETFTLPDGWSTATSCEEIDLSSSVGGDDSDPGQQDTGAYRSMFSKDWTRLAVASGDGADDHVGYLTADGDHKDLTGSATGFESSPDQTAPSYNAVTDAYIYLDRSRRVVSIAPNGRHRTEATGDFRGWLSSDANPAADGALSPNGNRVLSAASQSCDLCADIAAARPNATAHDITLSGAACQQAGDWYSPTRFLCQTAIGGHSNIARFQLDQNRTSALGRKLLPDTDRNSLFPIASPDHKQFAFASIQPDGTQELYVSRLKPGGHPTKLADLNTAVPIVVGWER
jgi:hypothetical protein